MDPDSVPIVNLSIGLTDEFKGKLWLRDSEDKTEALSITATLSDTIITLSPTLTRDHRSCNLTTSYPLKENEVISIDIPAGVFEISPDYIEVDSIDLSEDLLTSFSVSGAWHKKGTTWTKNGMFSIIDDDSLDGQIKSSSNYGNHGYFSLLYPLLESLGLKGNLAVEGRRTGISEEPPTPNDNLRTLVRLQNEKGWDILSHSMICLGEILNNWMVESLSSPEAQELLSIGPNNGEDASTISIYDLQTKKQYWPNANNTAWVETPSKFIKPYIGDYNTKQTVMYNPDYNIHWHWGKWKRTAIEFGLEPKGFVTHNATSSHLMLPGIMQYFPQGFSDLSALNINMPPLLSSAVRCGLEGQSLKGYDSNSNDNTFNEEHFKEFCSKIDEAAECGGWIVFNLHTYRGNWKNSLPGALVSEGGSYPDEWVIPMKGLDSANDPYSPPASLGINDWSEWYPCPGTRLHMLWELLKYAKEKGLINVTSSQGFDIMGNKKAYGYFSHGYKIGMDSKPSIGIRDKYPHYIVGANDETYYYNPILSEALSFELKDTSSVNSIALQTDGELIISGKQIYWTSHDIEDVEICVMDMTGKVLYYAQTNHLSLDNLPKGTYIVSATKSKNIVTIKKVII